MNKVQIITFIILLSFVPSNALADHNDGHAIEDLTSEYWVESIDTYEINTAYTIGEADVVKKICGNDDPNYECPTTSQNPLYFKYDVGEDEMGDVVKFSVYNIGEPHYVHLDLDLCRIDDMDPILTCFNFKKNLYEDEEENLEISLMRSSGYYLKITAKSGKDGDETQVRVSASISASSNNDRIEPELISDGVSVDAYLCPKDCEDGETDISDIFVFDVWEGDSYELEVWSREKETIGSDEHLDVAMVIMHDKDLTSIARYDIWDVGYYDSQNGNQLIHKDTAEKTGEIYVIFWWFGNFNEVEDRHSYSLSLEIDSSNQDYFSADRDGDGWTDYEERFDCTGFYDNDDYKTASSYPSDHDSDGECDVKDDDMDNDGLDNSDDNCPKSVMGSSLDTDGDGCKNIEDSDDDGDGVPDVSDALPLDPSENTDTDGDGIGNNADDDDDGDGYSDANENECGSDPLSSSSIPSHSDEDGICDDLDDFPFDGNKEKDWDGDGFSRSEEGFLLDLIPQNVLPVMALIVILGILWYSNQHLVGRKKH